MEKGKIEISLSGSRYNALHGDKCGLVNLLFIGRACNSSSSILKLRARRTPPPIARRVHPLAQRPGLLGVADYAVFGHFFPFFFLVLSPKGLFNVSFFFLSQTGSVLSLRRGWGIRGLWISMTYVLFGARMVAHLWRFNSSKGPFGPSAFLGEQTARNGGVKIDRAGEVLLPAA